MNKKYNQFIQQQMKKNKSDELKLVELGGLIRQKYELVIHREAILIFDREDGHLIKSAVWISEEEFKKYHIHVPDYLFYTPDGKRWIFEVDGWIHNVKDRVAVRDARRVECYKKAKLNFKIYNELDILLKQGKTPNRPATPHEIFKEMEAKLDEITNHKDY